VALLLACAPAGRERIEVRADLTPMGLERTRVDLEGRRAAQPGSFALRIALGQVYYRLARDALDRTQDEVAYLRWFEKATQEFVIALELDPTRADPHIYLGAMDAYRGDLDAALSSMRNAKRLEPAGTAYTNIAEVLIYQDRVDQAREWNDLAVRRGAPYGAVALNDMLLAWKAGNLRAAHRDFERLRIHAPESLREINMARLPREPRRFEEFAAYCCGSPACGPYMKDACADLSLEIETRRLSEDALRRELVIEIERQRRLRKLYEQRKELELEIEVPSSEP
jgi:tetratricopeptide (TPR) repeat protein